MPTHLEMFFHLILNKTYFYYGLRQTVSYNIYIRLQIDKSRPQVKSVDAIDR